MNKRPLSVTIIGCLFIAAGVVGLIYHASEFKFQRLPEYEIGWTVLLRLLAIVGGVFLLRGKNWARWLVLMWITYHVVLSAFHQVSQLITHAILLVVIGYLLLRPRASAYFRDGGTAETP